MRATEDVLFEDRYAEALDSAKDVLEAQRTPALMLAEAFRTDACAFGTLSRYEATLDGRLSHALRELRGLQEERSFARGGQGRIVVAAKRTQPQSISVGSAKVAGSAESTLPS